jgi:hypothetical protein
MPRDLFRLVKYLENLSDPSDPSDNFIEKIRKRIELAANELIFGMQDDAVKQWIDQNRSVHGRVSAAHKISALLSLFRDTAAFAPAVKDLYDFGLVKRTKRGTVTPCSQMACEALSYVFDFLLTDETPLREESNGAKRGFQLEQRFFHAMMLPTNARSFKVHPARSPGSDCFVKLGASLMQTTRCEDLSDIEPIPTKRSLWIPSSSTSVFDGILMPALEDIGAEPIVVFDPSVTEPYETDRRVKAKRLNALCDIMKLRFESKCSPVPLVIWDGELSSLERPEGDKLCEDMPKDVMIMDRGGLRSLGLAL